MQGVAGIVPFYFPHGQSEPHFPVMRRRPSMRVHGGLYVMAFAGHEDESDKHLKETGLRETEEESRLRLDKESQIGQASGHFGPGRRGKLYFHLLKGRNVERLSQALEFIRQGRHAEFDDARVHSLSSLRAELADPEKRQQYAQPELAKKILDAVELWMRQKPDDVPRPRKRL